MSVLVFTLPGGSEDVSAAVSIPETPADLTDSQALGTEYPADYITVAEAAEMANVTRQMISKLTDRGKINCTKVGSRIRIHRRDFEKWLQDREAGR